MYWPRLDNTEVTLQARALPTDLLTTNSIRKGNIRRIIVAIWGDATWVHKMGWRRPHFSPVRDITNSLVAVALVQRQ